VRRAFYSRALAPLKQAHNLAVLMTAHRRCQQKNSTRGAEATSRGGDILAVGDGRSTSRKLRGDHTIGRIVTVTLGELFSREGGGLDGLCTITIEDIGPMPPWSRQPRARPAARGEHWKSETPAPWTSRMRSASSLIGALPAT